MISFPSSKDFKSTVSNWSPKLSKLARDFYDFITPISWGIWESDVTCSGTMTYTVTYSQFWYFRILNTMFISAMIKGTTATLGAFWIKFRLPKETLSDQSADNFSCRVRDNGNYGGIARVMSDKYTVECGRADGVIWTLGADREVYVSGFLRLE